MEVVLDTFIFLLILLLQLTLFLLGIGLFWHFKRMQKLIMAHTFWLIMFAFLLANWIRVSNDWLTMLIYSFLLVVLAVALFFNPLKPYIFDEDLDDEEPDDTAHTVH